MAGGLIFTEANNLVARGVAVILYPVAIWFWLRWAVSRHAPEKDLEPSVGDDRNIHNGGK